MKKLKNAPFNIDAPQLAAGFAKLFSDGERRVMKLGIFPAEKMEVLSKCLRDKFIECATGPVDDHGQNDRYLALSTDGSSVVFSMRALVNEAMHEVTLALLAVA